MEFKYLDDESEKMLKEILNNERFDVKHTYQGYVIERLIENKYVDGLCSTTLSDSVPCYIVIGVTQKGKTYFESKEKYEKEKRRVIRREWIIAIISAAVGALIGLIPTFLSWIK